MILDTLAAAVLTSDPGRDWAVDRPSRSVAVVREAATPPPGWGPFARCVEHRESKGHAGAVNHGSGAAGLFQFMPAWRHGLPYMVAHRLHVKGLSKAKAVKVRVYLSRHPIQAWPATYQRIGFAEVISTGGWRHWTGGHGCNALAR